jgi:hypothetical protein
MAFFEDMVDAVEAYPQTYVQIEIVEVVFPGAVLNVEESGTFRVKVTNRGPLNITGLTLRIRGVNGAMVANNSIPAPFVAEFTTQPLLTITGHGGSALTVGSPLKFKAPAHGQASQKLVEATLEGFNYDLLHILDGHSDPVDSPKGTFAAEVVGL